LKYRRLQPLVVCIEDGNNFMNSINKDNINSDEGFLSETHWYAVHTKSKHEKIVYKLLKKKGLESYLTVRKVMKKWSDRKKLIELPLFAGYLFVYASINDKIDILNVKGVVRILGGAIPEIIPFEQIETLKKFENVEIEVDPYLHLKPGNMVRVVKGPLKGSTGFLIRKQSKFRLYVNMKLLMQSASVELDAADVEKI